MITKSELTRCYEELPRKDFTQQVAILLQSRLLADDFEKAKQIAIWVSEIEWEYYNKYIAERGE